MKLRQPIPLVIAGREIRWLLVLTQKNLRANGSPKGGFLAQNDGLKAVVGDTIANTFIQSIEASK